MLRPKHSMVSKALTVGASPVCCVYDLCTVLQERNLVSLPLRLRSGMPASLTKLQVLKRFEFESCLMRSGVVAVDPEGPPHTALLFVRGAPARIERLVKGGVLPDDYHQVSSSIVPIDRGLWGDTATYQAAH